MARADVESGLIAGRVPYIRGGTGTREAVVCFGVSALLRRGDAGDPGRTARQVARVLPGFRFTILGYAGGTFGEMTGAMASVVERAPEVVVGISFGGFVATRFAAEYPERARRLVLVVSGHRFSEMGERMMARQVDLLEQGDVRRLISENVVLFRRPWWNAAARWRLWREGERITRGMRPAGEILRDYRALFGEELARQGEYARRVACPALVVGGGRDPLFGREVTEETAGLMARGAARVFAREGHMLPLERSGAVAEEIARFVEEGR